MRIRLTLLLLVITAFTLVVGTATAQDSAIEGASIRDVMESEEKTTQLLEKSRATDHDAIVTGATPLATILGMTESIQEGDYTRAAGYLDIRYFPEELKEWTPEELVRALSIVWSQHHIVDIDALSDQPEGSLNDQLPAYRDLLGRIPLGEDKVEVYLQRVPNGQGGHIWKISNATVARIPELWNEWGYSSIALYLSETLPEFTIMGMENWQVFFTIMFFVLAWPLAILLSSSLMWIALRIPNGFPMGIKQFFRRPMRFFIFILLARLLVEQLNLSVTAKIILDSSGITYVAFIVLIMGLLSLLRDQQIRKMQRGGNSQYAALLKPITTIVKLVVLIGIALFWADSAGYNMTTILAGLGVGSLAVALAAQKTLENLFGAITLYLARPVKAGDFCRFGDIYGTVEDIGLRSTVLRTLNRTLVVIPNSVFSATDIENYSERDRIRYFRYLRVQPAVPERLRYMLGEIRRVLYSHPEISQETVSVRFETIEDANALVRIDAGVSTCDFQTFLGVAEDLNLHLLEAVRDAGLHLAGPTQSIVLREDELIEQDQLETIDETLEEWRNADRLPFPDFNPTQIAEFKASLNYPPPGSPFFSTERSNSVKKTKD